MRLFAGIDGGQTATQAVIGDADGAILGRGSAGPADEIGASENSTRLRDALEGSLRAAIADAKLDPAARFECIVAGISGYEERIYGVAPSLPADRLLFTHDAPIAHAGALDAKPGVVVIAGTGSVAYAVDTQGVGRTFGGFGYVFGDGGSAFWIASRALGQIARHADCPYRSIAAEYFSVESMRALFRAFYASEISRDRIASFARVCIVAAREGADCECLSVPVEQAALELACLASDAAGDELRDLAFTGGLMADAWFKERVYFEAQGAVEGVRIVEPKHDPAVGALLLARRV